MTTYPTGLVALAVLLLAFVGALAAGLALNWWQERKDKNERTKSAAEEKAAREREASRQADVARRLANVMNKGAARFRVVGDSEPPRGAA